VNRIARITLIAILVPFLLHAQTERWVYPYNGQGTGNINDQGYSVTYGRDGNIYAAGHSTDNVNNTGRDLTILKFATTGTLQWVYTYNATGGVNDYAYEILYGIDENIYAAGTRGVAPGFTVISVDTAGNERWVYAYSGPSFSGAAYTITQGDDGTIYAAGNTGDSLIAISIDTAGNERWVYVDTTREGIARSIAYGLDDHVYVCGEEFIGAGNTDFVLARIDTGGNEQWVYRYDGPANAYDRGYTMTYGSNNKVYAGGSHMVKWPQTDMFVISIDTAGNEQWLYTYNGPGEYNDGAHDVIYGLDGNLYIAGYATDGVDDTDVKIISIDTTGTERWNYTYCGLQHSDHGSEIVYAPDNNLYAVGASYGPDYSFSKDFVVWCVDTAGQELWVYRYDGANGWVDAGVSIVYGADSNLYAAGTSQETGTFDFTVLSLTTPELNVSEDNVQSSFLRPFSLAFLFSDKITLRFNETSQSPITIAMHDAAGTRVLERQLAVTPYTVTLRDKEIAHCASGVYFLSIRSAQRTIGTAKLLKLK